MSNKDTIYRQSAIDAFLVRLRPIFINNQEVIESDDMKFVREVLESLPSAQSDDGYSDGFTDGYKRGLTDAQPDNQINLCDSCDYSYPDCPSESDDVIFGNGIGNDNICACNKYKPSAQQEIIHCENCKHWVCGYITDNDDFIPPKCGKYQQMVGHSSTDYCSYAVRRTDG